MDIDLSELNELAVAIDSATGTVGARAAAVIRKTAYDVERDAKLFCPVDTGTLRSSISTGFRGDGRFSEFEAEVGPTAEYGAFVEYGTSRMAPHAYMGPALDRNAPGMVSAIGKLTEDLL